jgi:16S rRNA (adenine(1408)-N(1))-methyltransferase
MQEASRRAPANALFVVAAAEAPPAELAARAGLLTIAFPWGSLLRGVIGVDDPALAGIAALMAPDARLEVLLSITPRDRAPLARIDEEAIQTIDDAWCRAGLTLLEARPATATEVAAARSSWSRRLWSDPDRPVWRLVGRRPPAI